MSSVQALHAVTYSYQRAAAYRFKAIAIALAALLLSVLLDVATGPSFLPLRDVFNAVLGHARDTSVHAIVWTIRLPVALRAVWGNHADYFEQSLGLKLHPWDFRWSGLWSLLGHRFGGVFAGAGRICYRY